MSSVALRRIAPDEVAEPRGGALDGATEHEAARIVDDVRTRGEVALREHAERLGDLEPGQPLVRTRAELARALEGLDRADHDVLQRTTARIRTFAAAQLGALSELRLPVAGGVAGHTVRPVERAGCYAPGGRYPLPSSVLMTAVTARTAGVDVVWVASPRPSAVTCAAAALAGADALLAVGGAQAIAALAFGAGSVPACDLVCGPGNRWVTAAKKLVAGTVAIDMLAGPSELCVLADDTASAGLIAADLLAQAEHDPDARPVLVTTHEPLVAEVEGELERRLADLPTAAIARASIAAHGTAVVCASPAEAEAVADRFAPEHLELLVADPEATHRRLRHHGAAFLGPRAAEVLGDYGVGPNHVLPTGGAARSCGGLSVLSFLRVSTWFQGQGDLTEVVRDAAHLARLEGLEAHARAAEERVES